MRDGLASNCFVPNSALLGCLAVFFFLGPTPKTLAEPAPIPTVNADIRLLEPTRLRVSKLSAITLETVNYTGPVTILLDGVDISAAVERKDTRLTYRAPEPFQPGPHHLVVIAADVTGPGRSEWNLVIDGRGGIAGRRELYSQSSLSLSASHVSGDQANGNQTETNASLAVNVGVRDERSDVNFTSNFNYSSTAAEHRITPSGYLLQGKRDQDRVGLGDVSFKGTPLTVPSLARRGAMAEAHWGNVGLQLVQVNSQSVTGWNTGLGADNQLQGAALSYVGSGENGQAPRIDVVLLSGEILNSSSGNVSSTDAPSSGKIAGIQGSGNYSGVGYTVELGISEYDADTTDATSARHDVAGSIQLSKALGGISLTGDYQRAGPDYGSIANPGATYDREQYGLSAGTAFDVSALTASLTRSRDNLDNDPLRPVVYNDNIGLTYALTPESWPATSLGYTAGRVHSNAEPVGTPATDITNQSVSAAFSVSRQQWMSNLALNGSTIDDPVNGNTSAQSGTLSLQFQPSQVWNAAPSFSLVRSEHASVTQRTQLATVNLNWKISSEIGLTSQVVWAKNSASDNSVDNTQLTPLLRVSWDITRYFKRLLSQQQAGLSLSYRGNRYRDHLDPTRDQSDESILINIDISAPLEGRYGF